jgi:hypothetical protein
MVGEDKSGMQCAEFDTLLTEAIDGTLRGSQREDFEKHKAECTACQALFSEVTAGAAWLEEMEEVAPPLMLVHNILAATSAASPEAAPAEMRPSARERLRRQVRAVFAPVLTPRFAMSMGMAFFSITLVLNMAQIRIKDLTPHNLSHTFYSSQNKVRKYYENMRLVYEIESRVRDLRNQTEENERERQEQNQRQEKNRNQTQEQNQKSEPEPGPAAGATFAAVHGIFDFGRTEEWIGLLKSTELYFGELAVQRREL